MSLCTDQPRRIGSYLLVKSDRIQAHVPAFIAWCDERHVAEQAEYVRKFQAETNQRRLRWPQWWFGAPPATFEQARAIIEQDRADWAKREDWYFNLPHKGYSREPYDDNKRVARRLLAMSSVESHVFVSADDFDAVFRTSYGTAAGERAAA